jgi:hypothetical protein
MTQQPQVDANKVIESLCRQVAQQAQQIAILEAMLQQAQETKDAVK